MRALCNLYRSPREVYAAWDALAAKRGGRWSEAGRSVEHRPIYRCEFGAERGPTVLLTGLMHGVEVIGASALYATVDLLTTVGRPLLDHLRIVVLPVVNPDAFEENMTRLSRGRRAGQRCNARGVDLNRNFAPVGGAATPWHPFAGSRRRWSPHYVGRAPFSEPESRAVRDVALETKPTLSLGFHSFGNLLLYPWAHTDAPNPRSHRYRALGEAFVRGVRRIPYAVKAAAAFYRTVGDLDDWLDDAIGTLSFTVEVSHPARRRWTLRALTDPFCWMNPTSADEHDEAVANVAPAALALVRAHATSLDDVRLDRERRSDVRRATNADTAR